MFNVARNHFTLNTTFIQRAVIPTTQGTNLTRVIVLHVEQFRRESTSIVAEESVAIVMSVIQGTNTKHTPKESKHQKIKGQKQSPSSKKQTNYSPEQNDVVSHNGARRTIEELSQVKGRSVMVGA